MIFLGDVAIAKGDYFSMNGFPALFMEDYICLNLEGTLCEEPEDSSVYNHSSSFFSVFEGFNLSLCCLANNHVDDQQSGVFQSIENLKKHEISYVGAGLSISDARMSVKPKDCEGIQVLNFGWELIGCKRADLESAGVNPFSPDEALELIRSSLEYDNESKLVVVIHGNYEFEVYPQPSHRKFAMDAIDVGAHAIVFHHSHVVGPIEMYRGRVIAYGIGNWAFSYGRFLKGRLKFPEASFKQMALQIGPNKSVAHIAYFDPRTNHINYEVSYDLDQSDCEILADFCGFNHAEYLDWFRCNRKKRRLLPIFSTDDSDGLILFKEKWVILRGHIIDLLVRLRIKSLRRNVG